MKHLFFRNILVLLSIWIKPQNAFDKSKIKCSDKRIKCFNETTYKFCFNTAYSTIFYGGLKHCPELTSCREDVGETPCIKRENTTQQENARPTLPTSGPILFQYKAKIAPAQKETITQSTTEKIPEDIDRNANSKRTSTGENTTPLTLTSKKVVVPVTTEKKKKPTRASIIKLKNTKRNKNKVLASIIDYLKRLRKKHRANKKTVKKPTTKVNINKKTNKKPLVSVESSAVPTIKKPDKKIINKTTSKQNVVKNKVPTLQQTVTRIKKPQKHSIPHGVKLAGSSLKSSILKTVTEDTTKYSLPSIKISTSTLKIIPNITKSTNKTTNKNTTSPKVTTPGANTITEKGNANKSTSTTENTATSTSTTENATTSTSTTENTTFHTNEVTGTFITDKNITKIISSTIENTTIGAKTEIGTILSDVKNTYTSTSTSTIKNNVDIKTVTYIISTKENNSDVSTSTTIKSNLNKNGNYLFNTTLPNYLTSHTVPPFPCEILEKLFRYSINSTPSTTTVTTVIEPPTTCNSPAKYPSNKCNEYHECKMVMWWFRMITRKCKPGEAFDAITLTCQPDKTCL